MRREEDDSVRGGWIKELREGEKNSGQDARGRAVLPPLCAGSISYLFYPD